MLSAFSINPGIEISTYICHYSNLKLGYINVSLTNQYIFCSIYEGIDKMVNIGRISAFYPKVSTKRANFSEHFVEPNTRVGT